MLGKLIILFITVPLVELVLLRMVGGVIGLAPTIALVIITGIIGASLARSQGLTVLARLQNELAQGRVPTAEMLEGLMVLIGGAVLLTPGLLTDAAGFSLMIPAVRRAAVRRLKNRFARQFKVHGPAAAPKASAPDGDYIDV